MIRTSILVPLKFNDGKPVPARVMRGFNTLFLTNFGGYTIEGEVEGAYIGKGNRLYIDRSLKYTIAVELESLKTLREVAAYIRDALKQESVYLEVGVEVEFI